MSGSSLSSRFLRKGAFIDETRVVLSHWDLAVTVQENLDRILADNPLGARSAGWLKEVRVTLLGRLRKLPPQGLKPLVMLAQTTCAKDVWVACLHWHLARQDTLYHDFVTGWLFSLFSEGVYRMRSEDAQAFVRERILALRGDDRPLSDYGTVRAARDLFRMAGDFGLVEGSAQKEFASYHLPQESFLYLLHAMVETGLNARRLIDSADWHMFLLDSSEVERELLRLHQYRKLHYEVAGSLVQLSLPCGSAAEYAKGLSS